jgi:NADH-quinone oxidoreductase subunit J
MSVELGFFYGFALLAVASAVASLALVRHPVAGVMGWVVNATCLCGVGLLLEAHFVSIAQLVAVMGAAAMMLAFAVMLVGPRGAELTRERFRTRAFKLAGVAAIVSAFFVCFAGLDLSQLPAQGSSLPEGFGSARSIGVALFGEFVVPVEVTASVFLAASVVSFVLAKWRIGE